MGIPIILPISNQQLKEEYESGDNGITLGKKYNVSRTVIYNHLREVGCTIRSHRKRNLIVLSVSNQQLKEEYESGEDGVVLSKKYNVSCDVIYKRLESIGCAIQSRGGLNKVDLPITSDELRIEYDGGLSCRELAIKHDVSPTTISLMLKSVDYVPRLSGAKQINLLVTNQQLKDEYDSGSNIRKLAEKYNACQMVIWQRLKSAGYSPIYYIGENAANWKGGISFEPYCHKFNEAFKESIREKFNRTCFLCPITEDENDQKLSVHHVNYDKNCLCDDAKCEFVPLCKKCHAKTNGNRDHYESLIMDKIRQQSLQE